MSVIGTVKMEASVLNQTSVSTNLAGMDLPVAQVKSEIFSINVSWKKLKVHQWFKVHQWLKDKDLQNIKLIRWNWCRVFISERCLKPSLSSSFIIFVFNHRMYFSFTLIQPKPISFLAFIFPSYSCLMVERNIFVLHIQVSLKFIFYHNADILFHQIFKQFWVNCTSCYSIY